MTEQQKETKRAAVVDQLRMQLEVLNKVAKDAAELGLVVDYTGNNHYRDDSSTPKPVVLSATVILKTEY